MIYKHTSIIHYYKVHSITVSIIIIINKIPKITLDLSFLIPSKGSIIFFLFFTLFRFSLLSSMFLLFLYILLVI